MSARRLMVMGTGSNVGKSILVTALCHIFAEEGLRVAPFKAVNIALNAAVTLDGREIGRATYAQAEAAGIAATSDMNPVLIKPQSDGTSQLVLDGRVFGPMDLRNWEALKPECWKAIRAAFDRLAGEYELVVLEGTGGPAEINLQKGDIANMKVAYYARAPVLLVGDIERGGVYASLLGTRMLLPPRDRKRVRGMVINKLYGEASLLGDGPRILEKKAFNTPVLGVIPYLRDIGVAAEDGSSLPAADERSSGPALDIAVIRLPSIANFDDFDALAAETGVRVRFVESLGELGRPAAVILPGSKTTLADLGWLRERGLAGRIVEMARAGTPVVGICGGYQMMGRRIIDPEGVETGIREAEGLGLLPVETVFEAGKRTEQARARVAAGAGWLAALRGSEVSGYEIHMGRSQADDGQTALFEMAGDGRPDGLVSADGRNWGTYLHGLFDHDGLRHGWLRSLGWRGEPRHFDRRAAYRRLGEHVREHIDMKAVREIIGEADDE